MRILNLYAGLGGNRKFWEGEITSVESDPDIARVYSRLYPADSVVVGDAHAYLLENHDRFDFIWSSPPCQTHSKMALANKRTNSSYPSMDLYQQVILLTHRFKGLWVIENVKPYYEPLIPFTATVGRHVFWSNMDLSLVRDVERPKDFINLDNLAGKQAMMDWLGIHFQETLYYGGNHCPVQVLRNCVHPEIGRQIFNLTTKNLDTDFAGQSQNQRNHEQPKRTN